MPASDTHGTGTPAAAHSYVHLPHQHLVHPYIKFLKPEQRASTAKGARADQAAPWNVPDLCRAYNWPSNLDGGGVIAIVELGGGWLASDVEAFCKLANIPVPAITDISVDGTKNSPGVNSDSDGEVALDIQVAAAAYSVATGKAAAIRMYWASDIAAGVKAATADGCDVCSISWGADEQNWGLAAAQAMEQTAASAVAAGMVVFAASGDNNSADGGATPSNVDAPASCPHVIACGGTRKTPDAETVWNSTPGNAFGEGTGGGYSKFFTPMPPWQNGRRTAAASWFRTCRPTPIRRPDTMSSSPARPRPWAGPAPWRRSTQGSSHPSAGNWAGSARSSGKTIWPSTTSPRATTASIGRAQAPTRAPA